MGETVKRGHHRGIRQRLATEQHPHRQYFAHQHIGRVFQRHNLQQIAHRPADQLLTRAFVPHVHHRFAKHAGLLAISGIFHLRQVLPLPACRIARPESRAVLCQKQIAAICHRARRFKLIIMLPAPYQIDLALRREQLQRFGKQRQTVGRNRLQFGIVPIAQLGLQHLAAMRMRSIHPHLMAVRGHR